MSKTWTIGVSLLAALLVGVPVRGERLGRERGLSQSTETVLLLAGAAALAATLVGLVTAYVLARVPK